MLYQQQVMVNVLLCPALALVTFICKYPHEQYFVGVTSGIQILFLYF